MTSPSLTFWLWLVVGTMAQIVANNIAVESLTDTGAPAVGDSNGTEQNGGQAWRWSRTVATTADPKIVRIDIGHQGPGNGMA